VGRWGRRWWCLMPSWQPWLRGWWLGSIGHQVKMVRSGVVALTRRTLAARPRNAVQWMGRGG
jgi:hypothetical protein